MKFIQNAKTFIDDKAFDNVVSKMCNILSRGAMC